jgi:SAM-dependent methyltransferase
VRPIQLKERWAQLRTLVQRSLALPEAEIEGFVSLERMQAAVHYNQWLGQKFRPHLGRRVLEVGAGLGTITEKLAPGLELLIALEVEAFFVERLQNRFRNVPQVRPHLSGVELADWKALASERIESVVLSNVLEHIEDDHQAVRNFHEVLVPGGKLLVLVPALPALFGELDRSVGHYRRYTPSTLREALTRNGFLVESLEWMNLMAIPGWYVNGKLLRRRNIPGLQLRLFDQLMPYLARLESHVRLPVGMSLFAVARRQ